MNTALADKPLTELDQYQIEWDRESVRRDGLRAFVKLAWPYVEPKDKLLWNWHHDAICEHYEAVLRAEITELGICVPPGFTKSLLVSVLGSAYAWIVDPAYRMLAVSNVDRLSKRDSRKTRGLIQSDWYQQRWPMTFTKTDEARLENSSSGFRIVGSVGSGIIGERGNLILIDDPMSREDAESPIERENAKEFVWETLPTRVNNFDRDGKILIMQRLHGDDTAAQCIERGWEMLILPNEYEPDRCCRTSLGFVDPRKEEGELLHPERFSREATEKMKSFRGIGPTAYAGQYQQRPIPREGAIIKLAWLNKRFRVRGEKPLRLMQSWDCASKPKERNDPSACLTIAEFRDRYELWDYFKKRMEFPELCRKTKDLYAKFSPRPTIVLVEDKDAGQQLIQHLRADTESRLPVKACNPGVLDKVTRLDAESLVVEAGKVWIPEEADWVSDWIEEITMIPGAPHDESGDTLSQALKWFRENDLGKHSVGLVAVPKQAAY